MTTEWFFDTGTVVKLWTLQGEVDRWLIQSPQASRRMRWPLSIAAELREPRIFKRGARRIEATRCRGGSSSPSQGPDRKPFALRKRAPGVGPSDHRSVQSADGPGLGQAGSGCTTSVRGWSAHPATSASEPETPSHPSCSTGSRRLVSGGWSTKAIHRLILLSAAYQQPSDLPGGCRDTRTGLRWILENRLLWRMNLHRLTFEETRDTAPRGDRRRSRPEHGRPVGESVPHHGDERPSISLWPGGPPIPPSVLRVFDFANPDLHIPTRSETTVPQQALFAPESSVHRRPCPSASGPASGRRSGYGDPPSLSAQSISGNRPTPSDRVAREFLTTPINESAAGRPSRDAGLAIRLWCGGPGLGTGTWPVSTVAIISMARPGVAGRNGLTPSLVGVQLNAQGGIRATISSMLQFAAGRLRGVVWWRFSRPWCMTEPVGDGVRGWRCLQPAWSPQSGPVHNTRVEFNADLDRRRTGRYD